MYHAGTQNKLIRLTLHMVFSLAVVFRVLNNLGSSNTITSGSGFCLPMLRACELCSQLKRMGSVLHISLFKAHPRAPPLKRALSKSASVENFSCFTCHRGTSNALNKGFHVSTIAVREARLRIL